MELGLQTVIDDVEALFRLTVQVHLSSSDKPCSFRRHYSGLVPCNKWL